MIDKKHMQNGLLILLVVGTLALAFFLLFEKAERKRTTPASLEARKNSFLAAERFLTRLGFSAESIAKREILINPPSPDDLIFIGRLEGNLPTEREDNLIAWIEQGGTLVITHTNPWDNRINKSGNTLLDRLGVRRHSAHALKEQAHEEASDDDEAYEDDAYEDQATPGDEPDSLLDEQAGNPNNGEKTPPAFKPFEEIFAKESVTLTQEDQTVVNIDFIADRVLEDADQNAASVYAGESGNHIVIKALGKGKLIVLSDSNFLKNDGIGDNDHAYFLASLAQGRGKIWILYNSIMPSFLSLISKKAPALLASLVILSLMFVLWLTIRIGPRYTLSDHRRRNIIEHLVSAGFFIMKHGSTQDLLHVSRSAIDKKILAKHLFFHRKTKEEQVAYIAKWTQLTKEEVHAAFNNHSMAKDGFIAMSAALQKITRDILVNTHTTEKK